MGAPDDPGRRNIRCTHVALPWAWLGSPPGGFAFRQVPSRFRSRRLRRTTAQRSQRIPRPDFGLGGRCGPTAIVMNRNCGPGNRPTAIRGCYSCRRSRFAVALEASQEPVGAGFLLELSKGTFVEMRSGPSALTGTKHQGPGQSQGTGEFVPDNGRDVAGRPKWSDQGR